MKPHHAAALALVGWYLMAPPQIVLPSGRGTTEINSEAPLSKWKMREVFDTAAECKAALSMQIGGAVERLFKNKGVSGDNFFQKLIDKQTLSALCVATDDPASKQIDVIIRAVAALDVRRIKLAHGSSATVHPPRP